MEPKCCMNELCSAVSSYEWKKGWTLKSGGYATLCHACGSAFENSVFCETFHSEESGWRDCRICEKRLHCGCIASRSLHEYMDFGGVKCSVNCEKRLENPPVPSIQTSANIPNGTLTTTNGVKDVHSVDVIDNDKLSTERLLKLTKALGVNDVSSDLEEVKRKDSILKPIESSQHAPVLALQSPSSTDNVGLRPKDADKSLALPSLNISFVTPVRGATTASPFPVVNAEASDQSKRARPSLQKPPKPSPSSGPEATNKASASQERIARPPVEGKGRNQLLPRYWPKITDQELQQLSGDLKSTIVPLFEKILSASDAGRIGRLVLPKACAEAYFPTINQSEGIPIRIQDIKGKEWTFQFRFWPNNNSRMYVLEGVTPCIQNMQMQAGDTVIFSRRDPGGQLVIGCRKSSSNIESQDSLALVTADNDASKANRTSDDSLHKHVSASDKKKAKNIKNKRVRMNNDDAMGLRVTREEAQELFRPYPSSEPSIVLVEEHEFEEFEEPPVFGKKTIFISRPSGEQEQLAQCDVCLSWRRLPVNALLSASWTCSEKVSDSKRYTCWAPEDINPRDLESAIRDSKRRKVSYNAASKEGEPSGLDALATAAVLGDNIVEIGEPSSVGATTTRHPRHRPGCTCIVCSQPPSGKGKHEPTCKCNVCLTVKRRFKTLMMRKKKKLSEKEAELNRGKGDDNDKDQDHATKIDEDIAGHALLNMMGAENEVATDAKSNGNNDHNNDDGNVINNDNMDVEEEMNKGKLDLNSAPHKEEDIVMERSGLETCLASRKVASGEGDGAVEKGGVGSGDVQQENKGAEEMGNKIVA